MNPEDARRAVTAYREHAADATAALEEMLGQADRLTGVESLAEELKARIAKLIAQVDHLCSLVGSTDIAQTFNQSINQAGRT